MISIDFAYFETACALGKNNTGGWLKTEFSEFPWYSAMLLSTKSLFKGSSVEPLDLSRPSEPEIRTIMH